MNMPPANSPWPPPPHDQAVRTFTEFDAWYRGDPQTLQRVYGQAAHRPVRAGQLSGGVVGAVSRFFWGKPTPVGQSRHKMHVPVAADIATTSADLLFSEPPQVGLPGLGEEHPAQKRLALIYQDPEFQSRLLEAAEISSALTGVYLRIIWDKEVMDYPTFTVVGPDNAIPAWKYDRLSEVTFWTEVGRDGSIVYRHLEHYSPGRISHALYSGTTNNLGRAIPLQDHPSTAPYAELVDADSGIDTGTQRLAAVYWKNMGPQKSWRNIPELRPYGRSDYNDVLPLFDSIDEAYTSWMRDLRLGKARILVPQSYLSSDGPGTPAWFDNEQEVFVGLEMIGKPSDPASITPQQFKIRTQEHRDLITELLRTTLRSAGLSPATFGDDAMPISTTATEVKSRERLSERTRDKKIRHASAALTELILTLLEIDQFVYGGGAGIGDVRPEINFTEQSQQDAEELARTAQLLRGAEAATTETLVQMIHPDWDPERVSKEAQGIMGERLGQTAPDPWAWRPGQE